MTVTHAVAATMLNRLRVSLDAGAVTPASGTSADANVGGAGRLVIGASNLSGATGVLVTIALHKPSFSYSGSAATLLGVPLSANATATGTANKAEFRDNSGTTIISGLTVGTSGSDINLNSVAIISGQPVTITSAVITGA
jgi:hypothetical protein